MEENLPPPDSSKKQANQDNDSKRRRAGADEPVPYTGTQLQANKDNVDRLLIRILLLAILAGLAGWVIKVVGGEHEREGTIKTDDCRTRIVVKEGDSVTWFKTFTCSYRKTVKGTLIDGICEAVETTSGRCDTVYYYTKKGPLVCTDPSLPYLGSDEQCHSIPQ